MVLSIFYNGELRLPVQLLGEKLELRGCPGYTIR